MRGLLAQSETNEFMPSDLVSVLALGDVGRPRWLKVDASRTNLGESLQRALEADGTQLLDVPGEAHEQVGRVEVHGRYFEDMLTRALAQIRPSSRAEWLECVHQTMEAKNALTRRCGYSPF